MVTRHGQLVGKVIRRALRDLKKSNNEELCKYFRSELFVLHCRAAGYPDELRDTVADAMLCSEVHRKKMCEEMERLLDQWEEHKKKPQP